jgi:hypothetical protein
VTPLFLRGVPVLALALTLLASPAVRADDELSDEELDICISVARDPGEAQRVEALKKIARYGPRAKKAVAVLLDCLKSKDALGSAAADALGAVGPAAKKEAAASLREMLARYEDPVFQAAVVAALGQVDPDDRHTIKTLDELLQSVLALSHGQARAVTRLMCQKIAVVLEKAGRAAAPAINNLYALTNARFYTTRYNTYTYRDAIVEESAADMRSCRLAAVKALEAIGTPEARNRLGRLAVFAADPEVNKAARKSLEVLKERGGKAEE